MFRNSNDTLFSIGEKEKPNQFELKEHVAEVSLMNGVHIVLRFREELEKDSYGDYQINSNNIFWVKKNQQFNDYVKAMTTSDQVYMLNTDHVSSVKLVSSSSRIVHVKELEGK